jgi:hypothetical protein
MLFVDLDADLLDQTLNLLEPFLIFAFMYLDLPLDGLFNLLVISS